MWIYCKIIVLLLKTTWKLMQKGIMIVKRPLNTSAIKVWLVCLTPLSTIIQLYRGGQFYWWRKPQTCRKSLTNAMNEVPTKNFRPKK